MVAELEGQRSKFKRFSWGHGPQTPLILSSGFIRTWRKAAAPQALWPLRGEARPRDEAPQKMRRLYRLQTQRRSDRDWWTVADVGDQRNGRHWDLLVVPAKRVQRQVLRQNPTHCVRSIGLATRPQLGRLLNGGFRSALLRQPPFRKHSQWVYWPRNSRVSIPDDGDI